MKAIGWTVAWLLLALVFSKNALASGQDDDTVPAKDENEAARGKITRLFPVSGGTSVDPDIQELRNFLDDLLGGGNETRDEDRGARTFGHKRIQFMLMPMMYKMGVMMTLLTVLVVISLKGLLVGVALLVLKLSTIIAKFSNGWQQHQQHVGAAPSWPGQPIHVHVHNSPPYAHSQAYNGWITGGSGPGDEENYYYKG